MSTPTPPASPAEANRPPDPGTPGSLPWEWAARQIAETPALVNDPQRETWRDIIRRACEQWARYSCENWRQHDAEMHKALAAVASERETLQAQRDCYLASREAYRIERDTLQEQLALCRAVLEDCRPMVKAHLLEMERFGPGDESIVGRIERALTGGAA